MNFQEFEGNYVFDMNIKKDGKIQNLKKKVSLSAGISVIKKIYKEINSLIEANKVSYGCFRDCLNQSNLSVKWPVDKYNLPCAVLSVEVFCVKDGIRYSLKNLED